MTGSAELNIFNNLQFFISLRVDIEIVTVNKAPHGRAPDYFWFRTEFLQQKKLLLRSVETDGLRGKNRHK